MSETYLHNYISKHINESKALLLNGDLNLRQPRIKLGNQAIIVGDINFKVHLMQHNLSLYKQTTGQNQAKLFEMFIYRTAGIICKAQFLRTIKFSI